MDNRSRMIYNIGFALLCAGLFYLMPYIALYTMEGDKTDILMGMTFVFIPEGLLLLSILYGFLAERIIAPICIASVLSVPAIFIPIVAGNTAEGRSQALALIIAAIFAIVCLGTVSGTFIRRLIRKIKS